jgi:predicted permease
MIRTFSALGQVPPGFISENVQTFRLTVPQIQVPQAENTARMMQGIMDRVAAIPGVTNVASASTVPLSGDWMTEEVRAESANYSPGQPAPSRRVKFVSPGFFSALGTRLIAGRDFSWTDNYDLRQVAIVSEKLAREEWRTPEGALGKRLQLTRNGSWKEVIAVVADVHDDALNQPSPPIAYFPILMDRYYVPGFVARTVTLVARTPRAGTESLLPEIQKAVWSVNPNLALADVRTMGNLFDASMARTSFALVMLAISGAVALALGVVGIYGLLAYTVEQRRCEVGIRMALGAQPATVRSMFVRRGLALSGLGIAVGLGGAAGLSRLMSSLLFGVEPLDLMTYAATAVSLMAAAVAASYIPALRAAAIDPVETLRGE